MINVILYQIHPPEDDLALQKRIAAYVKGEKKGLPKTEE